MASQQPPARPWFRLASMARPAPAPTPAPPPTPAPQPAPVQAPPAPFLRPTFAQTFRPPMAQPQPTQPQAPAQPPTLTVAAPPPATAPPPTAAAPPPSVTAPPPQSPTAVAVPPPAPTTTSVPTSPIIKVSAGLSSLPTSPAPKPSPTSTILPVAPSSSVPPSPKQKVSAPSSSLPTSPAPKASPTSTVLPVAPSSSVPPSPKLKTSAPSSSILPTSPVPKVVSSFPAAPQRPSPIPAAPTTIGTTRAVTQTSPAKFTETLAKTPPPSPKFKVVAPPPSPLTLPPAQIKPDAEREPKIPAEAEQKTVLVQETFEKPKVIPKKSNGDFQRYVSETHKPSIAHNGKRDVRKDEETKDKGIYKKFSDSEEFGMRVITIAGENKGAIMELSPSHRKHDPHGPHKKGHHTVWSDGEKSGSDGSRSNEEERSKMKDKSNKAMATTSPPMAAFMNSNVQGVNNSILYNCSCTHHDPGVHLSLSRKANGGGR